MAKKLCVVFPGRRYSTDRSLLYFPTRILESRGFETFLLHYDVPREVEEVEPLEVNIRNAARDTLNATASIPFEEYDEVVFLSKSIGTLVACNLKNYLGKRVQSLHQILVTPLEQTLPLIEKNDLVIVGDHDRFFPDAREKLALYPNAYVFPSFTHSLEAKGNYRLSIKTLGDICGIVDSYLQSLDL